MTTETEAVAPPLTHTWTFHREVTETTRQWGQTPEEQVISEEFFCSTCPLPHYARVKRYRQVPNPASFGWLTVERYA